MCMKKNTTLAKKLLKYTGATGAVLAGGAVNGQVLYTDFTPDSTATANGGTDAFAFDINQDNTLDFALAASEGTNGANSLAAVLVGPYAAGNAIAGSVPSSYPYAFKLNNGDAIDANTGWLPASSATGTMAFTVNGANPYSEPWNGGVTDGFLGLQLSLNGNTHYGWARCDVSADAKTVTLKDVAVQLTPGLGINAGQSVSTIEELKAKMTVVTTGKTLRIEVPAEMGNYSLQLLDITGKVVVDTEVNSLSYNVNTANLSNGVYILNTRFGDTILSRKVSLQ